jgi:hypothetical protein
MARQGIEVAIDYHDEPFYGKQEQTRAITCSGQAKKGTTHFVAALALNAAIGSYGVCEPQQLPVIQSCAFSC